MDHSTHIAHLHVSINSEIFIDLNVNTKLKIILIISIIFLHEQMSDTK